ncbi:cation channel sperm-associated auxiliary subunit TMEM249 [Ctenodactylus gundi]
MASSPTSYLGAPAPSQTSVPQVLFQVQCACRWRGWGPRRPQADHLYLTQHPKGWASPLPTTSYGSSFQLWLPGPLRTELHLAKRLKNNDFYPFSQQQPGVFVLEYYMDALWKGILLLVISLVLINLDFLKQVKKQETRGFLALGLCVGLWIVASSLPRRRLVLDHTRGTYQFSIQGRMVCQKPLHLICVCLTLSCDVSKRRFFQLVLCGHKLDPLVLVQMSEHYEQMEYLGRFIAGKLDINYFDYPVSSYRHVIRHRPLGITFSPAVVLRRDGVYNRPHGSLWDLDV